MFFIFFLFYLSYQQKKTMEVKSWITFAILGIVGIVVSLTIIGGFAQPIREGAQAINYPNNCSEGEDNTGVAYSFNYSDSYCYNSTTGKVYLAKSYALPLSGLFTPSGITVTILMIALFIGLVIYALKLMQK